MINLKTDSSFSKVQYCTGYVQGVFSNENFWNVLHSKKKVFDPKYTTPNFTTQMLEQLFRDSKLELMVKTYLGPRKVLGYYSPSYPLNIYLNSRRLDRTTKSICGTLAHEVTHRIDAEAVTIKCGHGDNSPVGKENTVPYWFGQQVIEFISKQENKNLVEVVGLDKEKFAITEQRNILTRYFV